MRIEPSIAKVTRGVCPCRDPGRSWAGTKCGALQASQNCQSQAVSPGVDLGLLTHFPALGSTPLRNLNSHKHDSGLTSILAIPFDPVVWRVAISQGDLLAPFWWGGVQGTGGFSRTLAKS